LFKKVMDQVRPYAQIHGPDIVKPFVNFIHYGDPSLYDKYEKAIEYAKKRGLAVRISVTASVIGPRHIESSVRSGLDEMWLMVDGMDEETFRKIRGPLASFEKGIENLDQLLAYKKKRGSALPSIFVFMVKHPHNRHQWEQFNSYFGKVDGITYALAHFSTFSGGINEINMLHAMLLDDSDEMAEAARVERLNEKKCYYPWHSISVLSDGRAVPCCRDCNGDYVLGDLNYESVSDIWNGKRMQMLRKAFNAGDRNNELCRFCKEGSLEIGLPPRQPSHIH
jgi:radical SAM protein with 4Fe4S-binding SPASM domain